MRSFAVALIASLFLFVGNANANYTIDLIWSDSGTPTLTVDPGDPAQANSGACAAGAQATIATGRCLEVRLTAAANIRAAVMTIGWNAGSSGVVLGGTGGRSHGAFGSGPPTWGPVTPAVAGTADCTGLGCDSAHGSFGGGSPTFAPAGVYTIGSINFNTSGAAIGMHDFLAFIRTGVGGALNAKGNPAPIQLNGAILNVIPEPGTASLLGLGIVGLVAAGRRRKA